MKSLILFILFTSLITTTLTAQQNNPEVFPKQVSIDHNEAVQKFSRDYVMAFANSLFPAEFIGAIKNAGQASAINTIGSNNLAHLIQQGFGNASLINIWGSSNEAKVKQEGSYLFSVLNMLGNDNQFRLNQQGRGEFSYITLWGSGLNFKAFQNHNGMKLIQSGANAIPLIITRRGAPTPIIIRNY